MREARFVSILKAADPGVCTSRRDMEAHYFQKRNDDTDIVNHTHGNDEKRIRVGEAILHHERHRWNT